MPLYITKQILAKIKCDAIVNVATERSAPLKGIDILFYKHDGSQLFDYFKGMEEPKIGEAVSLPTFDLPYKLLIHTVANGFNDKETERQVLKNCYENSLNLAVSKGVDSVAISLNSMLENGLRERALRIAIRVVKNFLKDNELNVYLVTPKRTNFLFNKILHESVEGFIRRNYEPEDFCYRALETSMEYCDFEESSIPPVPRSVSVHFCKRLKPKSAISELLKNIDDTFAVTLLKLIDLKGMTDVECYKNANVSKQTWYKILNDKKYKPSKNTVIAFSISLKLNFDETQHLLSPVGFTLSKSSKFDIIIEYFIRNGIYDIMTINETLFEYDQSCLGV